MYLFKTSGKTFDSVIANQKHAFRGKPSDWYAGEIVLVSKNKADLNFWEKQISYIMKINNIRQLIPGEIQRYWPTSTNNWKWLVECFDTVQLPKTFNLYDIQGLNNEKYNHIQTFCKIAQEDEARILAFLRNISVDCI